MEKNMNINQAIKNFREELKCKEGCICWDCFSKHSRNGCSYGLPSGADDYVTECECND